MEPGSATTGFDPASLAILDKLQDLQTELSSLTSRLNAPAVPPRFAETIHHQKSPATSTFSDNFSASDPVRVDLARHLQRGNLDQVLGWDIWQPHRPRDAGLGEICRIDPPPSANAQGVFASPSLDPTYFTGYLDAFFRNVHILNPVLEERQIRNQLTQLLLTGVGWDASSSLLLLVLANGACSTTYGLESRLMDGNEQRWKHAQALYDAAEKRKDAVWRAGHLTQARCHFYSGVFMMASLRPFDAWRHFLQGLATCQILIAPTDRCKLRDPELTNKQAMESMYWSCWKSERELRFELEVPDFAFAGLYDHPVMFPTIPQASDRDELREWYFYLAEISLWRFEMTARQNMADAVKHETMSVEALADRVLDLEQSLKSWHASLPQEIRFESDDVVDTSDLLLFVLRGRLTYSYEVLTWPFLERRLLFEQPIGPQATPLVIRATQLHCERLTINRPGFYHRHHGTWLMQRSSARSALVLLAVARSTSADLLPVEWLDLVSDTINMLEHWSQGYDDDLVAFMRTLLSELVR